MKKILILLLTIFLSINTVNATTSTASSYILMDMDSKRVLASKNKDTPMLIASITNVVTT